jgi:hypothetical protein
LQRVDFIAAHGDRHAFRARLICIDSWHDWFHYVTSCRLVLLSVIICLTVA